MFAVGLSKEKNRDMECTCTSERRNVETIPGCEKGGQAKGKHGQHAGQAEGKQGKFLGKLGKHGVKRIGFSWSQHKSSVPGFRFYKSN